MLTIAVIVILSFVCLLGLWLLLSQPTTDEDIAVPDVVADVPDMTMDHGGLT